MIPWFTIGAIAFSTLLSLQFSTLTYALRGLSRAKLADYLERVDKSEWLERTMRSSGDLIFVTAVLRLIANLLILICVLHIFRRFGWSDWAQYFAAAGVTGVITLFSSVAVPHALAEHAGDRIIGAQVRWLHMLGWALAPVARIMHAIDHTVANAAGAPGGADEAEQDLQQEILSAVEEGEKEGVVDEQEREMIESVIEFGDRTVAQAMTARTDVVGLPVSAGVAEVKRVLIESGHSRLPVYSDSLDHVVGVLYARDLLKFVGDAENDFDIRSLVRPAFYSPETRLLRDLLQDFRIKKVHLAIVLDEYGGTAGVVSIEDVLEELVGEISDEHEPTEPNMIRRIDDRSFDIDAQIRLDELNRAIGLDLPEDAGYETLGGFVSNTLGRIPEAGVKFEQPGVRFTIVQSEPARVTRVKIEILGAPMEDAFSRKAVR